MADKPNSSNPSEGNLPAVRNTSVGKPQVKAPPPAADRVVGEAAGASSSNGALLDAIRQSSRLTVAQLEKVNKSVLDINKSLTRMSKDMEPLVRYYARKFQRWMIYEEEYYKQSVRLILIKKGVADQFPSGSSIYKQSSSAAPGSPGAKGTSGEGESGFDSVLKKVGKYSQTPITLLDDAIVGLLKLPFNLIKKAKDKAATKSADMEKRYQEELAAEAEDKSRSEAEEGFDRLDRLVRDQLSQEPPEYTQDEESPDVGTSPGDDLPEALTESASDSMSLATLYVDELVLSGMGFMGRNQGLLERNVTPEAALDEPTTLPANILPFTGFQYVPPEEAAEALADKFAPLLITATAGLAPPAFGSDEDEGMFSPGGIFGGGNMDIEDARIIEVLDDHADNAKDFAESYFAPVVDFFLNPENSQLGHYLAELLGKSGGTGLANESVMRVELPKWLQVAVFTLLAGLVPFLLGAAAFFIVGAVVMAMLAAVVLPFIARLLPVIADGIKAFVGMAIRFFEDPGAFIAQLAEGMGEAIKSIFGALIDVIAEAFDKIPILKTLSDFLKDILERVLSVIDSVVGLIETVMSTIEDLVVKLGEFAGSIVKLGTTIVEGIERVFKSVFDNIEAGLNLVGALVQLVAAIVGTAILTAIIKILAAVSWIETFFKSGGFTFNPRERDKASKTADAAYDRTVGAYVKLAETVASTIDDPKAKVTATAMVTAVKDQFGLDRPADKGPAGSSTVNNQTTVVNANPGFYGIPIYGGGF